MISLEAIISFLCFLAVLGVFAALLNTQIQLAVEGSELFNAVLDAEKCSVIIDSFYANSGGEIDLETACTVQGAEVITGNGAARGKATILNRKTKIMQLGNGTVIEVMVGKHYER